MVWIRQLFPYVSVLILMETPNHDVITNVATVTMAFHIDYQIS